MSALTEAWIVGEHPQRQARWGARHGSSRRLGRHSSRALVDLTGVLEDVYVGCANRAGGDNRNAARILTTQVHEMNRRENVR